MGKKHFSPLYKSYIRSKQWRKNRQHTVDFFGGRDALFPLLKGRDCDHLHYSGLERWAKGWGHEIPLIDAVLLHPFSHWIVGLLRKALGRAIVNLVIRIWIIVIYPLGVIARMKR